MEAGTGDVRGEAIAGRVTVGALMRVLLGKMGGGRRRGGGGVIGLLGVPPSLRP